MDQPKQAVNSLNCVTVVDGDCSNQQTFEIERYDLKPKMGKHLPTDPKERKRIPLFSGVMNYFPDALVAIAQVSQAGNDQHNPGQPLHWSREKSSDHEDTIQRHLLESGTIDTDGLRHTAKAAWRILAKLQLEIEAERNGNNNQTGT